MRILIVEDEEFCPRKFTLIPVLRLTQFDRVTFLLFDVRCCSAITTLRAVSLEASLKFGICFENAHLKPGMAFGRSYFGRSVAILPIVPTP